MNYEKACLTAKRDYKIAINKNDEKKNFFFF